MTTPQRRVKPSTIIPELGHSASISVATGAGGGRGSIGERTHEPIGSPMEPGSPQHVSTAGADVGHLEARLRDVQQRVEAIAAEQADHVSAVASHITSSAAQVETRIQKRLRETVEEAVAAASNTDRSRLVSGKLEAVGGGGVYISTVRPFG
jgi:hypothetical protein